MYFLIASLITTYSSVIIKANIVKHNDEGHLLKVSYESNSWNGNGTLCDDGWDDRAADIICKQNGFLVSNQKSYVIYQSVNNPINEKN